MAYEMDVLDVSLLCRTDLSGKQYRFVKLSADNTVAVCGNGEKAFGILQNKPDGSVVPKTARVRVFGVSRLEMQATCAFGEYIGSQANGEGLPVSSDHDYYCAICIDGETVVGNELCTVLLIGPSTLSA
jgi:hypothetical protein